MEQLKFTHTLNAETQYRSGDTRKPLPLLPLPAKCSINGLTLNYSIKPLFNPRGLVGKDQLILEVFMYGCRIGRSYSKESSNIYVMIPALPLKIRQLSLISKVINCIRMRKNTDK